MVRVHRGCTTNGGREATLEKQSLARELLTKSRSRAAPTSSAQRRTARQRERQCTCRAKPAAIPQLAALCSGGDRQVAGCRNPDGSPPPVLPSQHGDPADAGYLKKGSRRARRRRFPAAQWATPRPPTAVWSRPFAAPGDTDLDGIVSIADLQDLLAASVYGPAEASPDLIPARPRCSSRCLNLQAA